MTWHFLQDPQTIPALALLAVCLMSLFGRLVKTILIDFLVVRLLPLALFPLLAHGLL